jgi:hypothetical protein
MCDLYSPFYICFLFYYFFSLFCVCCCVFVVSSVVDSAVPSAILALTLGYGYNRFFFLVVAVAAELLSVAFHAE